MSRNKSFSGPLADYISAFLEEQHSLGYKYRERERQLYVLDRMSNQFDCSQGLPKDLCLAFVDRDPNWRQGTQESRVDIIRVFASYLTRHEIPAHMVDRTIVTNQNEQIKPYIFTHSQMSDIFNVADNLKPHHSKSHIFYPVVLRMQYGCGLRIGETLNLRRKDVDLNNGILHVISAKNNKDRDIPVSDSVMEYVRWYDRKCHSYYDPDEWFFKPQHGNGPRESTAVNRFFQDVLFECGIMHGKKGDGGPHLHNLRHTFCVHSLEAMLKNGIPHQVGLPLIMTYCGHSNLNDTGRYLKLTAEAFPELMEQINHIYADMMPDLEAKISYEDE